MDLDVRCRELVVRELRGDRDVARVIRRCDFRGDPVVGDCEEVLDLISGVRRLLKTARIAVADQDPRRAVEPREDEAFQQRLEDQLCIEILNLLVERCERLARAVVDGELAGKCVVSDRINDIVRELVALVHLVEVAVLDGFLEVPGLLARRSRVRREPGEGKLPERCVQRVANQVGSHYYKKKEIARAFKVGVGCARTSPVLRIIFLRLHLSRRLLRWHSPKAGVDEEEGDHHEAGGKVF